MKLTMFIGIIIMVLLCFVGFTHNEFIGEAAAYTATFENTLDTIGPLADLGITVGAAIPANALEYTPSGVTFYIYKNYPNPFKLNILSIENEYAISTGRNSEQHNLDTFAYKIDIIPITMRIGADNLKYPIQSRLVG